MEGYRCEDYARTQECPSITSRDENCVAFVTQEAMEGYRDPARDTRAHAHACPRARAARARKARTGTYCAHAHECECYAHTHECPHARPRTGAHCESAEKSAGRLRERAREIRTPRRFARPRAVRAPLIFARWFGALFWRAVLARCFRAKHARAGLFCGAPTSSNKLETKDYYHYPSNVLLCPSPRAGTPCGATFRTCTSTCCGSSTSSSASCRQERGRRARELGLPELIA